MANKPITLYQGEDAKLDIDLQFDPYNPANVGPNIPSPVVTEVRAFLFRGEDTTALKSYAWASPAPGEGIVEIDDTVLNRIHVVVTREESKTFGQGQLNFVVHADFVDADYPSGRREVFKGTLGVIAPNNAATAV